MNAKEAREITISNIKKIDIDIYIKKINEAIKSSLVYNVNPHFILGPLPVSKAACIKLEEYYNSKGFSWINIRRENFNGDCVKTYTRLSW
jgi:hypothetical protein